MLDWRVWPRRFVEIGLTAVCVPDDKAVLDPPVQGASRNTQAIGDLCFREHPTVPEPVIARAEPVLMEQICDAQVREAEIGLALTRGAARTEFPFG